VFVKSLKNGSQNRVFDMAVKDKNCKISFGPKGAEDWEIILEGDCAEVLQFVDDLPPARKRYLLRRVKIEG
jgi:hypothetical protein